MAKYIKSVGQDRVYNSITLVADAFVEIPRNLVVEFVTNPAVIADIENGNLLISHNGTLEITNVTAALEFFSSPEVLKASHAIDKEGINQNISGTSVTKITANRLLWDELEEYDLTNSRFYPPYNGVWNMNGTVAITPGLTVTRMNLHIYRNDELYFTVASEKNPIANKKTFLTFTCDIDGYAEEGHYFDLRIELEGVAPEATISGSAEETAWGGSLVTLLHGTSPT